MSDPNETGPLCRTHWNTMDDCRDCIVAGLIEALSTDACVERMAEAAWNSHATIPWAQFFSHEMASQKKFYLDAMRAAIQVIETNT